MTPGFYPPHPVNVLAFLSHPQGWTFLAVIVPMSLLDTICSLQILESVKVAGDDYPTRPSLLVNGLATLLASFFGSAFPHHPLLRAHGLQGDGRAVRVFDDQRHLHDARLRHRHRAVGAAVRAFGSRRHHRRLVRARHDGAAFTEVPKSHSIAVAFGLIPMLAGWALELVDTSLRTAGSSLLDCAPKFGGELQIYGLIALSQGSLLTSMLWAAAIVWMIERQFLKAAIWLGSGAVLSCFG